MKKILIIVITMLVLASIVLSGCTASTTSVIANSSLTENDDTQETQYETASENDAEVTSIISNVEGSLLDVTDMFTDRDLEQEADLEDAEYIVLTDNEDVTINEEGTYVLSGSAVDMTIIVKADDEAKVQLVLDDVSITNESAPAIYIISADKVFVTLTDSDNYLEVSGEYEVDGETNLDAVIFSKSDLVLNGTGSLEVVSNYGNGITSKDDLKITGGTYTITSLLDGLEANDSIRIAAGDITIESEKDALHSENDDDSTLGYIYILDGSINIAADDDGIRGTGIVQIDGGQINIETCYEGIEGTYIQINDGDITIYSLDDGINATAKSNSYDIVIEINGGTIDITMANGDTDAFDSNDAIYVNDGTIDISAESSFDANGIAQLNGGTVTVNGQEISEITQSQMGGNKRGR